MTITQTKIQRTSRLFRLFFQAVFIILPCLQVIAWVIAPQTLGIPGNFEIQRVIPANIEILHHLSWATKLYGFLVSSLPLLAIEFILYCLIRLFRLYEQGEIFTLANVNYIRKIGYALLLLQIIRPIAEGFVTLIVSWGNPPGHRIASINLTSLDLSLIITAFLIILISWIMSEGCRLREEQQLTI